MQNFNPGSEALSANGPVGISFARKKVVFCFNTGRVKRFCDDTPDDFFYGFRHYHAINSDSLLVEPHPDSQGLVDHKGRVYPLPKTLHTVTRALKGTKFGGLTRVVQILFAGRDLFRNPDAVVAVTNTWIYAFSLLKRFGLARFPVVGVAIGPFNPAEDLKGRIRNWLKRFLFTNIHLVFLAEADETTFRSNINSRPQSSRVILFGIDDSFWCPGTEPIRQSADGVKHVFSIGSAGRDYGTLLKAYTRSDARLRIVTSILDPDAGYADGVEVVRGIWHSSKITDLEIREWFRNAAIVVCPLFESTQPCGQSATLQAMACGKAVILTETEGLWDPKTMRSEENCILVPVGDTDAMRTAIGNLLAEPEDAKRIGESARRTVVAHFSANTFARTLNDVIESVINPELSNSKGQVGH